MLKVGITGGIGSGKSTVAKFFELLGTPVYYADAAAKRLMQEDQSLHVSLTETFGSKIFIKGKLDNRKLAEMVFSDPQQLQILNNLVHPVVINDAKTWMLGQKTPIVMKEAALFFESASAAEMDIMIGVFCPKALRIERVMRRDGSTKVQVEERMAKQISESIKMKLCDFVIINDDRIAIIPQVLSLYQKLLAMKN